MPILCIEGPAGLSRAAKGMLAEKVTTAMFVAYQMPDDQMYLNEYYIENDGYVDPDWENGCQLLDPEPVRPLLTFVAPRLASGG